MYGGKVFIEQEYPNLIFVKNGEEYTIDGKSILVVGGAYSVDKECKDKRYDVVYTYMSNEIYPNRNVLPGIDQSKVDNTMEEFLEKLKVKIRCLEDLEVHLVVKDMAIY